MKGLLLTVVFPQTVTLVFDGWTNIHYESVWVFIALLPVGALILKTCGVPDFQQRLIAIQHSSNYPVWIGAALMLLLTVTQQTL